MTVLLPGKSHGWRSLVGYSPWSHKESDTTELLHFLSLSGEGNGNPLQYSCLENPMDRGTWWSTICGVAKTWTQLSDEHFHLHQTEVFLLSLYWLNEYSLSIDRLGPTICLEFCVLTIVYSCLGFPAVIFDLKSVLMGGIPSCHYYKQSACHCRNHKRCWLYPWVWKMVWNSNWHPLWYPLPRKFRGYRHLVGYNLCGCKELDTKSFCGWAHKQLVLLHDLPSLIIAIDLTWLSLQVIFLYLAHTHVRSCTYVICTVWFT